MKKLSIFFMSICIFFSFFAVSQDVFAAKSFGDADTILNTSAKGGGFEGKGDVALVVGNIIKGALAISGTIFFVLMVYAGILWMTARGKDDQVDKARDTIIAAVIGIIILVASYAITSFVQNQVISGNAGTASPTAPNQAGGEKVGCCIDWIGADATWIDGVLITGSRWTTYADCKYWGENNGNGDSFSCAGPKAGCWIWEDTGTYQQCEQLRLDKYTK